MSALTNVTYRREGKASKVQHDQHPAEGTSCCRVCPDRTEDEVQERNLPWQPQLYLCDNVILSEQHVRIRWT